MAARVLISAFLSRVFTGQRGGVIRWAKSADSPLFTPCLRPPRAAFIQRDRPHNAFLTAPFASLSSRRSLRFAPLSSFRSALFASLSSLRSRRFALGASLSSLRSRRFALGASLVA